MSPGRASFQAQEAPGSDGRARAQVLRSQDPSIQRFSAIPVHPIGEMLWRVVPND